MVCTQVTTTTPEDISRQSDDDDQVDDRPDGDLSGAP
jgi:hypothetical protein